MESVLHKIDQLIWQPLFIVLIGIGLFLTFRLKGIQFRSLGYALKLALTHKDSDSRGDISHFQALMTALAATIGIGNIAGVATAIATGGLGALFWLWLTALIGMAIKYGEAILAIHYRVVDKRGGMAGGPMYYLANGLGWKKMAYAFAFFGVVNTFFTGNMVQSHSIATAFESSFHINQWVIGIILAAATGMVLLGGIRSIGKVASFLVPIMALFYVLGCLGVLMFRCNVIPEALRLIVKTAFTGQAALGGFAGSTVMVALQMGVARGIFSNESGLGSSPIAAAAAKTDFPGRQAMISMIGAFLSTIVCTFTGLAIAVTHMLGKMGINGKPLNGAPLTIAAFDSVFPFGGLIVVIGSILFGYSTIIGWAYYGEKCCEYLFGEKAIFFYRMLFSLFVFLGVGIPIEMIWTLADITNACMALPNLIGVLGLTSIIAGQTRNFLKIVEQEKLAS